MNIERASKRKIPRKFQLPWGKGMITEEAAIKCSISIHGSTESWEPTIQLLEFESGEKAIRFCVYGNGRLRRMPLILDKEQAKRLALEIDKNRKLRSMIMILRNKPKASPK
ncbi:MAG: hypothetical protein QXV17_11155 [Candidatus Micrarchaeaceae archaeon]